MRRPFGALLVALAVTAPAAGCGGSDEAEAPPPEPAPSATPSDFPSAQGKTVVDLRAVAEPGPILAPSVSVLQPGRNRFGFALFDVARKQIAGARVAIYTARQDGTGLRGPFVARSESLAVRGAFQSRTTSSDPDAAKSVYVADVPFGKGAKQVVTALAKLDGRLVSTDPMSVQVRAEDATPGPPDVGEKAIRVHTPTLADVGGDATRVSTRQPPAEDLHEVDFADALGKRPVVISFATPLLCQSRVCGPVVDVIEQVKASAPKDVAFIHQEIYNDNRVDKGFRPQIAAWKLPTEPWTFVIDRRGRVVERFEGAFSAGELERAVADVS